MNIGIDARPLHGKKTGIGYYLENLLSNILQNDKKNNYFLFSDRGIVFSNIGKYNNLHVVRYKDNFLFKKTLFYVFRLPNIINKQEIKLDIFWGTQHILPFGLDKRIYKILTIHDLVCYEMPETMALHNMIINKAFLPMSIKCSDTIIAVSKSTKNGLNKHFHEQMKNKNNYVIYEGADGKEYSIEDENKFYNRYADNMPFLRQGNYILFVGTIEPRKNVKLLLEAYKDIRKSTNLKLVLCGKVGWKADSIINEIKQHVNKEDIVYLNYVSNDDKYLLMKSCFAFIFPSLYEGFGLPVVEAMKMGAVSLVSKSSSLNELIEKEELKFDKDNSIELSTKVIQLYNNREVYEKAKEYCIKRAKDFVWEDIALKYIDIFNSIIV